MKFRQSRFRTVLFVPVVLIVNLLIFGCAAKPAKTPQAAFLEFQKAMVFNRRADLQKFASGEYIKQLEAVFDLIVISSQWPADHTIKASQIVGDKAALKVSGTGRQRSDRVVGAFKLEKRNGFWVVTAGDWISASEFVKDVDAAGEEAYNSYVDEINGRNREAPAMDTSSIE